VSFESFRIISLAAFLADVEGHANKAAFVFDDPISSLDQDYEEAAARRLVKLSLSRQVIVFTHRLSMLALLEEEASKRNIEPHVIGIEREPWGAGEPVSPPSSTETQESNQFTDKSCERSTEGPR
jgi:hypothetical protein